MESLDAEERAGRGGIRLFFKKRGGGISRAHSADSHRRQSEIPIGKRQSDGLDHQDRHFGPSNSASGTFVSMSEEVLEFHNGARISTGSHQVAFAIEDVKISERTDSGDLTEAGDVALAVMFTCNSGKCIQAYYGGKPSTTDWADISLQDETIRNNIRKAFETIQHGK
jgi:hypothetical protein